jgi:ribonuclease HII
VKNITFHTKGESLYPSVALASVIARYSFLRKMEELSEHYQMDSVRSRARMSTVSPRLSSRNTEKPNSKKPPN